MHEAVASPLAAWESFYVIVGSSAAALTGSSSAWVRCVASAQAVDFRCLTGGHKMLCPRGNPRLDAEGFSGILEAPDDSTISH